LSSRKGMAEELVRKGCQDKGQGIAFLTGPQIHV
jgi:hypothetical protein